MKPCPACKSTNVYIRKTPSLERQQGSCRECGASGPDRLFVTPAIYTDSGWAILTDSTETPTPIAWMPLPPPQTAGTTLKTPWLTTTT